MKISSLSATRIKTYKLCEFKYYLTYIRKVLDRMTYPAEAGSVMHVLFELAGQQKLDGVPDSENTILNNYHKELLTAFRDEDLWRLSDDALQREKNCQACQFFRDGLCEIAGENVDEFEGCPKDEYLLALELTEKVLNSGQLEFPLDQKLLNVEDDFQLKIPHGNDIIKVNGIIDVVTELDKNTIEIVDYKTGRYKQSYNECKKDPQLLIYHLAAKRKWKNYENILVTIYYLQGKPLTLAFGEKEEEGTEKAIRHYYKEISDNNSPKRIRDDYDFHRNRRKQIICEKMCDMCVCDSEYEKFKMNGHTVLPESDKKREKKQWLSHLMEDSNKEQAYKSMHKEEKDENN